MTQPLDPIAAPDARFEERYVEVDRGVELRVFRWAPKQAAVQPPLVFVPGWVSVVDGWAGLLRALVGRRPVVYLETREKGSARIARRALAGSDFSIPQIAADLVAATSTLGVGDGQATIMASSLGATAVLEGLKERRLAARCAFLVGPNTSFRFPLWGHPLLHLPAPAYRWLKHLVLWYLRTFRVDAEREPEQMERYDSTLRAAHPQRIKLSAMGVRGYQVWPGLGQVRVPVAVAYASSDALHDEGQIRRLVRTLPEGQAVQCPTNLHMHSAEVAADLAAFEDGLARG